MLHHLLFFFDRTRPSKRRTEETFVVEQSPTMCGQYFRSAANGESEGRSHQKTRFHSSPSIVGLSLYVFM